ncbi:MAG: type II toxin-antitoxin system HicB family antitoxin [Treponema sp.]|nr:type II toxin-antitoxin system HicB family antitoxin [Treponema sp.]
MNFKGTIIIKQEEEWVVATCLENNIASQGKTIDEALVNLKEAISLYYDDEVRDELNVFPNNQIYITTLDMAING